MKKHVVLFVVALCLFTFSAQTVWGKSGESGSPQFKLGTVNLQQALNEVEEGKKAKAKLKEDFDKEQKKLEILRQELADMQGKLEQERLVSSGKDYQQKEENFKQKLVSVQNSLRDAQQNLAKREMEVTGAILNDLKVIVLDIGKKENYTFIFEGSQDVLLYSPNVEDITAKVISLYNAKSKAGK